MTYTGTPVLLLGGAGFIGRWVGRALSARGARLVLPVRDPDSATRIFGDYGVMGEIVEMDLRDLEGVRDLVGDVQPAVCFNLAGYGVDRSERDSEAAFALNRDLVAVLCEEMVRARDGAWKGLSLVHAGSALEYGEISGDLSEDSEPNPTTLYGRSKLAGTDCVVRAVSSAGLRGTVGRLFTVYGPGEHEGRLLPSLIGAAQTDADLPLTEGRQQRDFTYVEDVADGLVRLSLLPDPVPAVLNIARGHLRSVRYFTEEAAAVLGIAASRLSFGALPTRGEEMAHGDVAVDLLRGSLGWAPSTGIAEGVRATARWAGGLAGA